MKKNLVIKIPFSSRDLDILKMPLLNQNLCWRIPRFLIVRDVYFTTESRQSNAAKKQAN